MLVSERVYWIILITFFTALALIIWLWLVPYQILEYNLAVNLFTSSIFMVITVVFLSLLLDLREKAELKIVYKRVNESIGWHLKNILSETTNLLEIPSELFSSTSEDLDKWDESYAKYILAHIEYLHKIERKDAKLSHTGENVIRSEKKQELCKFCNATLGEIDLLMILGGKVLTPKALSLLMQLREDLRGVIELSRMDDFEEKYLFSFMAIALFDLINDIYEINKLEIKIHGLGN